MQKQLNIELKCAAVNPVLHIVYFALLCILRSDSFQCFDTVVCIQRMPVMSTVHILFIYKKCLMTRIK